MWEHIRGRTGVRQREKGETLYICVCMFVCLHLINKIRGDVSNPCLLCYFLVLILKEGTKTDEIKSFPYLSFWSPNPLVYRFKSSRKEGIWVKVNFHFYSLPLTKIYQQYQVKYTVDSPGQQTSLWVSLV